LRQANTQSGTEEAGPRTACQDHGIADDAPSFGDDGADPARAPFYAAHRTVRQNDGALALRGARDGGRRELRLGATVGGHIQSATVRPACARHERLELVAAHDARTDVVRPRHVQPAGKAILILLGFPHVHDAAGSKAGFAFSQPVHVAP